ncbi:class I lanthipeptide [Spirosoma gilvum]
MKKQLKKIGLKTDQIISLSKQETVAVKGGMPKLPTTSRLPTACPTQSWSCY